MNNASSTLFGIEHSILLVLLLLIVLILTFSTISAHMHINRMKRNYTKFMRGKDGTSLEKTILTKFQEFDEFARICKQNSIEIQKQVKSSRSHYQRIGLVRYNAFVEMGGNLSFALTMLDLDHNGWIMNVMHSRDGCYTYMKEILAGESYVALSDEEKESLERAMFQEHYDIELEA